MNMVSFPNTWSTKDSMERYTIHTTIHIKMNIWKATCARNMNCCKYVYITCDMLHEKLWIAKRRVSVGLSGKTGRLDSPYDGCPLSLLQSSSVVVVVNALCLYINVIHTHVLIANKLNVKNRFCYLTYSILLFTQTFCPSPITRF